MASFGQKLRTMLTDTLQLHAMPVESTRKLILAFCMPQH